MATLLHTNSGKGVLLIDDYGNTYSTSLAWLKGFADKSSGRNFLIFTKLPGKTGKFGDESSVSGDPLSSEAQKSRQEEKVFGDVEEW